jgi:hypothetical protein
MDSDTANEYHENISDLSDPTVEKVSDYIDNAYISKLFSILPVFAFIQSGQGARGQINLGKVMPTTNLSNILSTAVNYTLNNILNDSALSSKYIGTYLNYFDQMYAKPSENVLPEDVSTIKPIFKNYYKDSTTEEEKKEKKKETKKKFLTTAEYNSDVLLYDSTVSLEEFRSKIKEYLGPKTGSEPATEEVQSYGSVIVMSNSSDKYDTYNASFNGNRYNSTVIKDMFVNKEILADAIRAVITKKKSFTSKTIPGDFLTDATYDSNVQNIDKLINKLIEDRDVHKRRIYFDSKGIGNTLLGYAGDEKLTEENLVAGNAPAPKTFVYLSKRLYEEFGYINPGLFEMNALIEEGNILKAQVLEKQTVTDEMVREKLRECFKSLLES